MLWNQIPEKDQGGYERFINQRFAQLNIIFQSWTDRVFQYLILTNAGGAVAVLTFLSSSPKARLLPQAWITLAVFALGLILTGISTAIMFYQLQDLTIGWLDDIKAFYKNDLQWEILIEKDEQRAQPSKWLYRLNWTAFGCLICGVVFGFWCLSLATEWPSTREY